MDISSINYSFLIDEFPEETEAVNRLTSFIEEYIRRSQLDERGASARPLESVEFTVGRIFDVVNPTSKRVLVRMLLRMVEQGILTRTIRVVSDNQGGIGDYESITDIPPVVFDEFVGHNVEVTYDNLREIYKFGQSMVRA